MKTLKTAIRYAKMEGAPLHRAINGLDGCPVGGWAATSQALAQVIEALPVRSERRYSADDLVESVMVVINDRYQWRR